MADTADRINGVEFIEISTCRSGFVALDGWAVYSGCEGDDPSFRGFFVNEEDAHCFAEAPDPDDPEDPQPMCCDPQVVHAILTGDGIYSANDFEIKTHNQLRARVAAALTRRAP